MPNQSPIIRFPQGLFPELRHRLLQDKSREAFALLIGQRTTVGEHTVIKVVGAYYPEAEDYENQSIVSLRIKKEYIYKKLVQMQQSGIADTIVDVHTHPFSHSGVVFSGVDDQDEQNFHAWLNDKLDHSHYASIVLSQSDYSARIWEREQGQSIAHTAYIKTQVVEENWPCADKDKFDTDDQDTTELESGFLARSTLALGLDTMRQITNKQTIAIIGVGGLGSVIAENLIHSGFQTIHLIDPDHVEMTNLNRIVGAYYSDAEEKRLKAEVVQQHLQRINPKAQIYAHTIGIEDKVALPVLMQCDWIIVATDNHFSRYKTQEIALQLGIPLISTGVNISVKNHQITDMSGEIITARYGDKLCLNCLGRINPTYVAAEQHKDQFIGDELIRKGYVTGEEVKEPAVKTLNSIVGAMAVDVLVNQYTQRQEHKPVLVYENNKNTLIYEDNKSLANRNLECYFCH